MNVSETVIAEVRRGIRMLIREVIKIVTEPVTRIANQAAPRAGGKRRTAKPRRQLK